ncbi:hypothetical protein PMI32_02100, partial [Pseudomonas sp. GM60]
AGSYKVAAYPIPVGAGLLAMAAS